MAKVKILRKNLVIEADEAIDKTVMAFSKSSAHVILPKRWIGADTVVVKRSKGEENERRE